MIEFITIMHSVSKPLKNRKLYFLFCQIKICQIYIFEFQLFLSISTCIFAT